MNKLLVLLLLASCATHQPSGPPREGKTVFSYTDISGNYRLSREFKTIKKKLVTRSQIFNNQENDTRVVEKSVLVSQLGSIKGKKARVMMLRPQASEFTVWLEGKKYNSKMQINPKTRSMNLKLTSPEAKWNGQSEVPFPRGKYFCFFNQLPECLYHNYLLNLAFEDQRHKIDFFIIWDGFPFLQDQLSNVGKSLFAPATIKFDGEIKKNFRYIVEVEGQLISYLFSSDFDMLKMSWIVQGINVVPPGEEVTGDL